MRQTVAFAAVAGLLATSIAAQAPTAAPLASRGVLYAHGEDVSISLLTVGVGSKIWELFGHSALWIHDGRSGRDTVFNWGAFDQSAPNFILRFIRGPRLYQLAGDPLQEVISGASHSNRTVVAQELDLTAPQKEAILRMIRLNALPANLVYRYDYFLDNCATRPRDILDRALGGQLHAGADSLSARTYRSNTLRLLQEHEALALGVDLALGERSDRSITKWQEMFLPKRLHDWVATRQVRDSTGDLHPLVKSERVLVRSSRPSEPARPPDLAWLWIAGSIVGGLFAWFGSAGRTSGAARVGAAVVFSIWSFAAGLLGVTLALLWAATDHEFVYANENLLLFNPLWLLLAVVLPLALWRGRAIAATRWLILLVVGLASIALLAHVVGWSQQANLPMIGLGLPPVVGLLGATRQGMPGWIAPNRRGAASRQRRTPGVGQ